MEKYRDSRICITTRSFSINFIDLQLLDSLTWTRVCKVTSSQTLHSSIPLPPSSTVFTTSEITPLFRQKKYKCVQKFSFTLHRICMSQRDPPRGRPVYHRGLSTCEWQKVPNSRGYEFEGKQLLFTGGVEYQTGIGDPEI